ncbi:MAG: thermonuclease family protein [Candidatus Heimdallarchaeaceae archaeon]
MSKKKSLRKKSNKTKPVRRKVQEIIDGDTFKVRNRVEGSQYIRIAGINAPEKGQKGYFEAKKKLSKLKGKTVTIKPKGKSYGRTVAEVIYKRKKIKIEEN